MAHRAHAADEEEAEEGTEEEPRALHAVEAEEARLSKKLVGTLRYHKKIRRFLDGSVDVRTLAWWARESPDRVADILTADVSHFEVVQSLSGLLRARALERIGTEVSERLGPSLLKGSLRESPPGFVPRERRSTSWGRRADNAARRRRSDHQDERRAEEFDREQEQPQERPGKGYGGKS